MILCNQPISKECLPKIIPLIVFQTYIWSVSRDDRISELMILFNQTWHFSFDLFGLISDRPEYGKLLTFQDNRMVGNQLIHLFVRTKQPRTLTYLCFFFSFKAYSNFLDWGLGDIQYCFFFLPFQKFKNGVPLPVLSSFPCCCLILCGFVETHFDNSSPGERAENRSEVLMKNRNNVCFCCKTGGYKINLWKENEWKDKERKNEQIEWLDTWMTDWKNKQMNDRINELNEGRKESMEESRKGWNKGRKVGTEEISCKKKGRKKFWLIHDQSVESMSLLVAS